MSIITPTAGRQQFLPTVWQCVREQTFEDFEWLIHDGSAEEAVWCAADPRVTYVHDSWPRTIGAKRNHLCAMANGETIVHFDDDDYYAPHYIAYMLALLDGLSLDFVKLSGFFVRHVLKSTLGYVDLERDFPLHYVFDPDPEQPIVPTRKQASGLTDHWGYGFSYVYRRHVWDQIRFPDINHGEDIEFARQVIARFRAVAKPDWSRSCLHLIHGMNTSRAFPQQILPEDWFPLLFPQISK